MAKQKVYGFSEDGFKKVREATRRVLGTARRGSQRRRQVAVTGSLPFLGKADANIAARTAGTVSVYQGQLGGEADTGENETAFNLTDQQADTGSWVQLIWMQGGLALLPVECPA